MQGIVILALAAIGVPLLVHLLVSKLEINRRNESADRHAYQAGH
jgi:hypothetical protein